MEMTYDRLSTDELRGTTQADYLISLDAHLRVLAGDTTLYDEPGFPVVELARALRSWLGDIDRDDFVFDSMSFEELGSVTVRQVAAGWQFGSIFASHTVSFPVDWSEVNHCCRTFIARVEADLLQLGINPVEVLSPEG